MMLGFVMYAEARPYLLNKKQATSRFPIKSQTALSKIYTNLTKAEQLLGWVAKRGIDEALPVVSIVDGTVSGTIIPSRRRKFKLGNKRAR